MSSLTTRWRQSAGDQALRGFAPRLIPVVLLLGLAYLAYDGIGTRLLMLLAVAGGAFVLLKRPVYGPVLLVLAAVAIPLEFGTGSEVALNTATLLVPALGALWLVHGLLLRNLAWTTSPADGPWLLFLAAGLLSLAIGRATWDPAVPVKANFVVVQLAQWAIFAFAALAYWLPGMLLRGTRDLQRMTWALLWIGGGLAILRLVPGLGALAGRFTTIVYIRAPFLVLLAGLAGGQLLFNRGLSAWRRLYLLLLAGAMIYDSTFAGRLSISEWVGVWTVLVVLVWQKFPRLRWPALAVIVVLIIVGVLFPSLWEFAGGELRWVESGGSRVVLIGRVLEATEHNPLTGLGPAAYRPYTAVDPLPYGNTVWFRPQVNAHNNYVDVYAHGGLAGLGLFAWLLVSLWRQAAPVAHAKKHAGAFESGFARGMLAVWTSSLVIMVLADWMLPFVYNIGFSGFQASVLVWLFLGGLTVLRRSAGGKQGDVDATR
ncbi:MAG: O-antigen ligase family protein [Anaerolineae bacterium]